MISLQHDRHDDELKIFNADELSMHIRHYAKFKAHHEHVLRKGHDV